MPQSTQSNPYDPPGDPSDRLSNGKSPESPEFSRGKTKVVLILGVIALAAALFYQFGELLSLETLAEKETQLRAFQSEHPYLVYGIAFLVYVVVTGLSLPGAAALTLVFGWYFGFWRALVLISFASTIGATLAFLLSRYLLGTFVQTKFGDRLATFNDHLEQDGAFYLFTLRLIPAVPFFVINLVMGLTKLKASTFYWVSQVGMLPGTAVYTFAGSRVPNLSKLASDGVGSVFEPRQLTLIVVAFALLGVFPLAAKKTIGYFQARGESPGRRQS